MSEYTTYLAFRGHAAKLVQSEFDRSVPITKVQSNRKVEKSFKKVIFTKAVNPIEAIVGRGG